MKQALMRTKRTLAFLLTLAMVLTSVPAYAYEMPGAGNGTPDEGLTEEITEEATEGAEETGMVEDETAPKDAGNDVAEVPAGEGGGDVADEELDAKLRNLTLVPDDDSTGFNNSFSFNATYGVEKTGAIYVESDEYPFPGGHSGFSYEFMGPADYNDVDLIQEYLAKGTDKGQADAIALMTAKALPEGLTADHPADSDYVIVTGTPSKVVTTDKAANVWYLVVTDTAATAGEYVTGTKVVQQLDIQVHDVSFFAVAADPAGRLNGSAVSFGEDSVLTSTSANAGYTVAKTKSATSTADNVKPVKFTLTATIDPEISDTVTATISEWSKVGNSDTIVQTGTDSSTAFTVAAGTAIGTEQSAATTANIGTGSDAVFTVAPVEGLTAQSADGTEYWAKLKFTSKAFDDEEYKLVFEVNNGLEIRKQDVTPHAGIVLAGDGSATAPYDLGSFRIGETINDVVIKAANGSGAITYTPDYTTTGLPIDGGTHALGQLPTGIVVDPSNSQFRLTQKAVASDGDKIGVRYFALTPKDSKNVEGAKTYFKYELKPADVEIAMIKGAYNADRAKSISMNGVDVAYPPTPFDWYGSVSSGNALKDQYATVHIKNKSEIALTYIASLTANKGAFVLDPATASDTGINVPAGGEATFKVVPKTLTSTPAVSANAVLKLTALGVKDTDADITYNYEGSFRITKPIDDQADIGPAYVGKAFTYTFEETHPSSITSVVWSVNTVKDEKGTHNSASANKAAKYLEDTYGLTLMGNGKLSGTLKKASGNGSLSVNVVAKPNKGASISTNVIFDTLPAKDGVKVLKDGSEIKDGSTTDFGPVARDGAQEAKTQLTITNQTLIEQKGVKVKISGITVKHKDNTTGAANGAFVVVYDENNKAQNAALSENGITLPATTGSASVIIAPDPAVLKAKGAGTYTLNWTVVSEEKGEAAKFASKSFTSVFTVNDVPEISDTKLTGLTYGNSLTKSSDKRYTVSYNGAVMSNDDLTFELISGEVPGLTLTSDGYYTGNLTKAGEYEVTVKATTKNLSPNVSTTYKHKIIVSGTGSVDIVDANSPSIHLANKTYLLPGQIAGAPANSKKLALTVKATGTVSADGMTVTVADAADDRDPADADDAKDIIKNPGNPYKGSAAVINAQAIAASITKDTGTSLNITTADNAQPGLYKVTVTVAGTNVSPVKFDLVMVVSAPLKIKAPANLTAQIGDKLSDTSLVLTAEGGCTDQTIAWSEAGTVVRLPGGSTTTEYYVTNTGAVGVSSNKTGLSMNAAVAEIGDEDGLGLKTSISGTPILAGEYAVNVKATVPNMDYSEITGTDKTLKAIDRSKTGGNKFSNFEGTSNKIFPAQVTSNLTFNLKVTKSKNPQITDLAMSVGGQRVSVSNGNIPGTVSGTSLGNVYSNITGYAFHPATTGYSAADYGLTITVTGGDGQYLTGKAKVATSNYFEVVTGGITDVPINKNGTDFVIRPKAMGTGTYTDTVTIEGDNIETLSLTLTFKVEEPAWKATVYNGISEKETDPEKRQKRVEYVKDMTSGEGTKTIELNTVIQDEDPSTELGVGKKVPVSINNTGNSTMYDLNVVEAYKQGSVWVDAEGSHKNIAFSGSDASIYVNIGVSTNNILAPASQVDLDLTNRATLTNGVKNTGLHITYYVTPASERTTPAAMAAAKREIYIPVRLIVLDKAVSTVSVTPAEVDGYVTLPEKAEGYASSSAAKVFTMTNTYSGSGEAAETIKSAWAYLGGDNWDCFDVTELDPANEDIAAGRSATFTVSPKAGLGEGTYYATVVFTGYNLAESATFSRELKFVVTKSPTLTVDKVTTDGVELNPSMATRLYNSLVMSGIADRLKAGTATAAPVMNVAASGAGKQIVKIDFDHKTGATPDVTITFEGTVSGGNLSPVTKAKVKLNPTSGGEKRSITSAPDAIGLTATEQEKAELSGISKDTTTKKASFFTSVAFKPYVTATLGTANPTGTEYTEIINSYKNENVDTSDLMEKGGDGDDKYHAVGQMKVLVPLGGTISSSFNSKSLPSVVVDKGKFFRGWIKHGTTTEVTNAYTIDDDIQLDVFDYGFMYPASSTKTKDAGINWVWTKDASRGVTAVLNLTDISGKYDTESLVTITKDTPVGNPANGYPIVSQAMKFSDEGVKPATCEKGSGRNYKAEVKFTVSSGDARTYSSEYVVDDAGDAPGHVWGDPVVTWAATGTGANGAYTKDDVTVTRTCRTDSTHVANLKIVAVNETITKAATCTKDGEATYSVTYTDVDKFGKDTTNVTDTTNTKTTVITKTGHKYSQLDVEWAEDHKTATKATLVCTNEWCHEGDEGHTLDVTGSVTYDPKYDGENIVANTAIYNAGKPDEVKSATWVDDVLYNPIVTWTVKYPGKVIKGTAAPELKYTVTYTSVKQAKTITTDPITVTATTTDDFSGSSSAKEVTFKAVADLRMYYKDSEGKTPATSEEYNQKYIFPEGGAEGYAKEYTYKSHKFTWPKQITLPNKPTVTATVTYKVTQEGVAQPDETLNATVVVSDGTVGGKYTAFTATLTDINGQTKTETQKYDAKGKLVEEGQGDTPSEPEQPENKTNINLFCTKDNTEIVQLKLPEGADVTKIASNAKFATYYNVADDGTVTVKVNTAKDLKKAANASNSLIVIPIYGTVEGSEGTVEIGEFEYSLPVYYQKPTLKLTSTSGTVNVSRKDESGSVVAQKLKTVVTEKKSTGAFEALEVDTDNLKYNATKGTAPTIETGENAGEVVFTATGKASGKLSVQLDNWVESVDVSYTVKEAKKNVLTGSAKTIIMNLNKDADSQLQGEQEFHLFVNGEPAAEDESIPVTVVTPNKWADSGLDFTEGVADGKVTAGTIKVGFKSDATPKKGSYTIKFQTGSKATKDLVTYSLKITVSNTVLDEKAMNLKKQINMDLTTGQKMVLIPQFKGISGDVDYDGVSIDNDNFAVEGNEELGQIWVTPAEGKTLSTKTNYTVKFTVTVSGVKCTKTLKIKPSAKKPTVKIDKVVFPKTKWADGSADGEANVLCTYTQGNKKFTIAPNNQVDDKGTVTTDAVTFMVDNKNKAPMVEGTDGWYKLDKANVVVKYDAENGTILVKPTGKVTKPKNASVKVWLNFNGVTIKKTLSVKCDSKK